MLQDSVSFLLWLIGIAGSVVGILAFVQSFKTRIYLFVTRKESLYNDLVKTSKRLKITYDGRNINENLILMRCVFTCSGRNDIIRGDVEKGIIISVKGEGNTLYEVKILSKSDNLNLEVALDEHEAEIKFNHLRNKDFFYVQIIARSDNKTINFDHRIAQVEGDIRLKSLDEKLPRQWRGAWLGMFFLAAMTYWSLDNSIFGKYKIKEQYFNNNGNEISKEKFMSEVGLSKYVGSRRLSDSDYLFTLSYDTSFKEVVTVQGEDSVKEVFRLENGGRSLFTKSFSKDWITNKGFRIRYYFELSYADYFGYLLLALSMIVGFYYLVAGYLDYFIYNGHYKLVKVARQNAEVD